MLRVSLYLMRTDAHSLQTFKDYNIAVNILYLSKRILASKNMKCVVCGWFTYNDENNDHFYS